MKSIRQLYTIPEEGKQIQIEGDENHSSECVKKSERTLQQCFSVATESFVHQATIEELRIRTLLRLTGGELGCI